MIFLVDLFIALIWFDVNLNLFFNFLDSKVYIKIIVSFPGDYFLSSFNHARRRLNSA